MESAIVAPRALRARRKPSPRSAANANGWRRGMVQVVEEESREQRRKTIQLAADEFLLDYKTKHESATLAIYALGHVTDFLGKKLVSLRSHVSNSGAVIDDAIRSPKSADSGLMTPLRLLNALSPFSCSHCARHLRTTPKGGHR